MADTQELQISAARDEIRQVYEWLMRPNTATLAACEPALERAVSSMRALSRHLERLPQIPPAELKAAAVELASEIARVQILLATAAKLYLGRMRELSGSS